MRRAGSARSQFHRILHGAALNGLRDVVTPTLVIAIREVAGRSRQERYGVWNGGSTRDAHRIAPSASPPNSGPPPKATVLNRKWGRFPAIPRSYPGTLTSHAGTSCKSPQTDQDSATGRSNCSYRAPRCRNALRSRPTTDAWARSAKAICQASFSPKRLPDLRARRCSSAHFVAC